MTAAARRASFASSTAASRLRRASLNCHFNDPAALRATTPPTSTPPRALRRPPPARGSARTAAASPAACAPKPPRNVGDRGDFRIAIRHAGDHSGTANRVTSPRSYPSRLDRTLTFGLGARQLQGASWSPSHGLRECMVAQWAACGHNPATRSNELGAMLRHLSMALRPGRHDEVDRRIGASLLRENDCGACPQATASRFPRRRAHFGCGTRAPGHRMSSNPSGCS